MKVNSAHALVAYATTGDAVGIGAASESHQALAEHGDAGGSSSLGGDDDLFGPAAKASSWC